VVQQPPSTEKTGPQKGDVIDGKLEIEGVIAEGRTSTVVSAIDRGNNYRKVAIKIARASDLESVERFKRAARGMQKLKSPYAVKVLGVGTTQDGAPCMTMEYLEGRTWPKSSLSSSVSGSAAQ
jgi:serine/threonine protein kinase